MIYWNDARDEKNNYENITMTPAPVFLSQSSNYY